MMPVQGLGILVTATLIACAPAITAGPGGNPSVITTEQIVNSSAANAYDLIHGIRPIWLRSRGQNTLDPSQSTSANTYAAVFVDGQRYGDITSLRSMTVHQIRQIRFLSGSDATTRYGTGYPAGVIEVITR